MAKAMFSGLLETKKKELDSIGQNFETKVHQSKEQLEQLRHQYQMLTGSDNRQELVHVRQSLEKQLDELEEKVNNQKKFLEKELSEAIEDASKLENQFAQEREANNNYLKNLDEQKGSSVKLTSEELGKLEKTIELTRKYYQEQLNSLEARKQELFISMDHTKAVFESIVEEKRKDLKIAIDGVEIKRASADKKFKQEKRALEEAIAKTKEDCQRIQAAIDNQKESLSKETRGKELEAQQVATKLKADLEKLQTTLLAVRQDGEKQIQERKEQLSQLRAQEDALPQELKKNWDLKVDRFGQDQESLKVQIKENQQVYESSKAQMEAALKSLDEECQRLKEQEQNQSAMHHKELARLEKGHKENLSVLQEKMKQLREEKGRLEVDHQSASEELEAKTDSLKLANETTRAEFENNESQMREHYNFEIRNLKEQLSQTQLQASAKIKELSTKKIQLESQRASFERELEYLARDFESSRQAQENKWQQERVMLEKEMQVMTLETSKLQKSHNHVLESHQKETQRLQAELDRQEAAHAQELSRLEELCEQERDNLERNLKQSINIRQQEVLALSQVCEELEVKTTALRGEVDELQKENDVRHATAERQYHQAKMEHQSRRDQLAGELREARRIYQEQIQETEQGLYLLRLKVDLRTRQLKDLLGSKKRELALYEKGLSDQVTEISQALASQLVELSARHEELSRSLKDLEGEKVVLDKELKSIHAVSQNYALEDIAKVSVQAKERMSRFVRRARQILQTQEEERQKLLQLTEQLGPLSKELRTSMEEWALSWDKEIRTMSHFLKGMETEGGWRH